MESIKKLLIDIFFPSFCVNCNKEGSFLCNDCFSLIDVLEKQYCPFCDQPKVVLDGKTCPVCRSSKSLDGLFCATSYDNFIVKNLIRQSKTIKGLSAPLAYLIIAHLIKLNNSLKNCGSIIIPVPLHKKELKQKGFNMSEEIAKELSLALKIPLINNVLIKREGLFSCENQKLIENKNILLVDDVFITGSTLEECSRTLKNKGAREVWGVVATRKTVIASAA